VLTILFLCTHNAGRSQLAEAFLNQMADGRVRAMSAGSQPKNRINPVVVQAMQELGIDLRGKKPKKLTPGLMAGVDRIISMGCGDACPITPTAHEDWRIDDPEGKSLDEVRSIRDQVQARVDSLVKELKI
jgi:arsenate reductase (thioredoxin)